jgi:hypothetical protein
MGLDIRNHPFDLMCLCCGDCIDASEKSQQHKGLGARIAFQYGSAETRWPSWLARAGIRDTKRALAVGLTLVLTVGLSIYMFRRESVDFHFAPRFERTVVKDGRVINHYTLSLGNRTEQPMKVHLQVKGMEGVAFKDPRREVYLAAWQRLRQDVVLVAPSDGMPDGAHPITVVGATVGGGFEKTIATRFFIPHRR